LGFSVWPRPCCLVSATYAGNRWRVGGVSGRMKRVKEYIDHARTCRDLAARSRDPQRKAELMELAAKWAILAEERERLLESQKRLAALP
jgi:hypothetical protein